MRILAVEDQRKLAAAIKRGLEAEGFAVDVAANGEEGLWLAREKPYDAIVLDILLPKLNGYKLCAALRDEGNWTPILMLSAKSGEWDEAEALDTGADDFLAKPFSYVVLVARLRALLRRGPGSGRACWKRGIWCWTRPLTPAGAATTSSPSAHASSRSWSFSCGGPGRWYPSPRSSTTYGISTSTAMTTSSRSTFVTCAARSICPSTARP